MGSNLLQQPCRQVHVNTACPQHHWLKTGFATSPWCGAQRTWLWILLQHPQAGISPPKSQSTDGKAACSRKGDAFQHPCVQEADGAQSQGSSCSADRVSCSPSWRAKTHCKPHTEPSPAPPSLPAETRCLHHKQPDPPRTSPPGGWLSGGGALGSSHVPSPRPPDASWGRAGQECGTGSKHAGSPGTEAKPPSHSGTRRPTRSRPEAAPALRPDAAGMVSWGKAGLPISGRCQVGRGHPASPSSARDRPKSLRHARIIVPFPPSCSCRGRAANLCVL